MSFSSELTCEQGEAAGRDVVMVAQRLWHGQNEFPQQATPQQLTPVMNFVADRVGSVAYINGFLSQVIRSRSTTHRNSIIDLWGADEFIANQDNYAPICNIDPQHQFIQFGDWCGEIGDGDGWCIDFYDGYIRCVPVGCDDETEHGIHYLRACCYGCFPRAEALAPYLETIAKTRGWQAVT